MMTPTNLDPVKQIPILEVATRLGIEVKGKSAMCFGGHDNKSPSLTFSPKKNLWNCFGCGKGGDSIKLVQEVCEVDFAGALNWFAQEFHVDARAGGSRNRGRFKKRIMPKNLHPSNSGGSEPSEFDADPELYSWFIDKCGEVTHDVGVQYFKNHGISLEVASAFGVKELCDPLRAFQRMISRWGADRVYRSGLAWGKDGKPDRLIWTSYALLFPFNHDGAAGYIQGRMFEGNRKFLNPRGLRKPLYNIDCLSTLGQGSVVHICEGVPDVISLHSKELSAVAVLGASSFRPEWVDMFLGFDVVVLPDGDDGGKVFADKISQYFFLRGKSLQIVIPPDGMDVSDVIAKMDATE